MFDAVPPAPLPPNAPVSRHDTGGGVPLGQNTPVEEGERKSCGQEAEQLCLECGLCCNGVLFDEVVLQPGDVPKALAAKGFKLKRGRRAFNQPCTLLDGTACTAYRFRPSRCRDFECRLLKSFKAGNIVSQQARREIAQTRQMVAEIEVLLQETAGANVRHPLGRRVATALANPLAVTSTDQPVLPWVKELEGKMDQLRGRLDTHFRNRAP